MTRDPFSERKILAIAAFRRLSDIRSPTFLAHSGDGWAYDVGARPHPNP